MSRCVIGRAIIRHIMLIRHFSRNAIASTSSAAATAATSSLGPNTSDFERMRLQMLGDPAVMNQLRAVGALE